MEKIKRGILISVEGIDGSGKSTLVHDVTDALQKRGFEVTRTKEPGGSTLGKKLRPILQTQTTPLDPKAEYLLFAADRAQHFADVVLPALEQHHIVISDRMADSSVVYQGFGRGLSVDMIKTINHWVMNGRQPDIVIYLHIPLDVARQRIADRNQELTAFEKEREEFTKKLITGFDTIFKNRRNVIHLDGRQSPDVVLQSALKAITEWINNRNLIL